MQISLIQRGDNQAWLLSYIAEFDNLFKSPTKAKKIPHQLEKIAEKKIKLKEVNKFEHKVDPLDNVTIIRENLSKYLVKDIIFRYIKTLTEKELILNKHLKIAFDFYGKGILVWINTEEEDYEIEEICKSIEKELNNTFSAQGIKVATNFVDKSLNIPFPPKYI